MAGERLPTEVQDAWRAYTASADELLVIFFNATKFLHSSQPDIQHQIGPPSRWTLHEQRHESLASRTPPFTLLIFENAGVAAGRGSRG